MAVDDPHVPPTHASVAEAFQASRGLVGVAPQARRLGGQAAAADEPMLPQPGQQGRDLGDRVDRLAVLVFERIAEGDEQLLALIRLRERCAIEGHVTIV